MSESPRPASTPPTLASEDKEDREVEKKATDLEVNENVDFNEVLISDWGRGTLPKLINLSYVHSLLLV